MYIVCSSKIKTLAYYFLSVTQNLFFPLVFLQRSLSFTKDPNSGPDGQAPGGWTRQRSFVRSNIANVRSSLRRYPGQRATGGVSSNPAGNNMVGGGNNDIMTQSVDQSIISRYCHILALWFDINMYVM